MLYLYLYREKNELSQLKFLQQIKENGQEQDHEGLLVVAPSPVIADELRSMIKEASLSFKEQPAVITMAKFLRQELMRLRGENCLKKMKTKAELILLLGAAFKQLFPGKPYDSFLKVYNIITDLRSLSVDPTVMVSIVEEYDQELAPAILKLWELFETLEIIDEHKAFALLGESYFLEEPKQKELFIFWGFNFFSGLQVDFLRTLGQKQDVIIPFHKAVFKGLKKTDWPLWLGAQILEEPQKVQEAQEVQESENGEERPKGNEPASNKTCRVVWFKENQLALSLLDYAKNLETLEQDPILQGAKEEGIDIFLGKKNPSLEEIAEIPFKSQFFKVSTNLFEDSLLDIFEQLENFLIYAKDPFLRAYEKLPDVHRFLQNLLQKELGENKVIASFSPSSKIDYRRIKLIGLVKNILEEWQDLSQYNTELTLYDLNLLRDIAELRLPRVFASPLLNDNPSLSVRGLEGLYSFRKEKNSLLVVSSKYGPLYVPESRYNEKLQKLLANLGPLRRAELDFRLIKEELKDMVASERCLVFLEEGLLDREISWSEIFQEFKFAPLWPAPSPALTPPMPQPRSRPLSFSLSSSSSSREEAPLLQQQKALSASSLQTYIDCPRKFFYYYRENIRPDLWPKNFLLYRQLGELEHKIIHTYLGQHTNWLEDRHATITKAIFEEFLRRGGLHLSEADYFSYLAEIEILSKNAILSLLNLSHKGAAKFQFEVFVQKEISPTLRTLGYVDCLIDWPLGSGILDFKRSSGGVPAIKEIENFTKIQLWFYLARLAERGNQPFSFWGYFNLSEAEESLLFVRNGEVIRALKESSFLSSARICVMGDHFAEKLEEYQNFERQLVQEISQTSDFLVQPRNLDVCKNCLFKNICPRQ